jgi:hypothetical protein
MRTGRATCLAPALALSLVGCNVSHLEVTNRTDRPVADVTIGDGASIWRLGELAPGGKALFSGRLRGEGGVRISWTLDGRRFSETGCYYTGGSPANGKVGIVGGELQFTC